MNIKKMFVIAQLDNGESATMGAPVYMNGEKIGIIKAACSFAQTNAPTEVEIEADEAFVLKIEKTINFKQNITCSNCGDKKYYEFGGDRFLCPYCGQE